MRLTLVPFMFIVGDYVENLLDAGCKIHFLKLDADTEIAKMRQNFHGQPGMLERSRSFDVWLRNQMNKHTTKGQLEARKYALMPTMHITIINEEKMFVNPYPVHGPTWSFPVIEIGKKGKLFKIYKRQFQEVWDKATPLCT